MKTSARERRQIQRSYRAVMRKVQNDSNGWDTVEESELYSACEYVAEMQNKAKLGSLSLPLDRMISSLFMLDCVKIERGSDIADVISFICSACENVGYGIGAKETLEALGLDDEVESHINSRVLTKDEKREISRLVHEIMKRDES